MPAQQKHQCANCGSVIIVPSDHNDAHCTKCGTKTAVTVSPALDQTVIVGPATNTATTDDDQKDSSSEIRHASVRTQKTLRTLGRFELKEVLGAGGFGEVYKAFDPQLERLVAIKIPKFSMDDRENTERFLVEAKAAARLKHTNIVTTYEVGKSDRQYFIATEFVDGLPLNERLKNEQPSTRQAVEWIIKLARACGYAHSQGIVHRDIKPHNIMISQKGDPQLMDFGLAKRLDDDAKATTDGTVLGTPAYMSPEQARGEISLLTAASDQYSLGVVLFQLLTSETPVSGSPFYVISQVAAGNLKSVGDVRPDLPQELQDICARTMAHDAKRRYMSCDDLASDLDAWLNGRPLPYLKSKTSGSAFGLLKPHVKTLTIGVCVAAVCLGAWGYMNRLAQPPEEIVEGGPEASGDQAVQDPVRPTASQAEDINDRVWDSVIDPQKLTTLDDVASMKEICSQYPQKAHFLHTLGAVQFRQGDYKNAVKSLQRSKQLVQAEGAASTNFADPAFLALIHATLNNRSESKEEARAFVKAAPLAIQANGNLRSQVMQLARELSEIQASKLTDQKDIVQRINQLANRGLIVEPAPAIEKGQAKPETRSDAEVSGAHWSKFFKSPEEITAAEVTVQKLLTDRSSIPKDAITLGLLYYARGQYELAVSAFRSIENTDWYEAEKLDQTAAKIRLTYLAIALKELDQISEAANVVEEFHQLCRDRSTSFMFWYYDKLKAKLGDEPRLTALVGLRSGSDVFLLNQRIRSAGDLEYSLKPKSVSRGRKPSSGTLSSLPQFADRTGADGWMQLNDPPSDEAPRLVIKTPELNSNQFGVQLRLDAESQDQYAPILRGGSGYDDIEFGICTCGRLKVRYADSRYCHSNFRTAPDSILELTMVINRPGRTLTVFFDKRHQEVFPLPPTPEATADTKDREWYFCSEDASHYFKGRIDALEFFSLSMSDESWLPVGDVTAELR